MFHKNLQQGSAIFFSIIVLAFILSIAFGLSALVLQGTRSLQGVDKSLIALYAAEAGVEHLLWIDTGNHPGFPPPPCMGSIACLNAEADAIGPGGVVTLSNGAQYQVLYVDAAPCPTYCSDVLGTYRDVSRKIEIER